MNQKLKTWLVLLSVPALIILAGFGVKATSKPQFCASCHQIKTAVDSWKNGAHSEVACLDCHAEPGFWGLTKVKAGGLKELAVQLAGSTSYDTMIATVPSSRCRECHWAFAFKNSDLARVHWGKDVNCGPCHRQTIHKSL